MKKKIWLIIIPVVIVAAAAGAAGGIGMWTWHENPTFCGTCHIMQPYVDSWTSSTYLANTHSQAGVTCLDCHEPDIKQQMGELVTYVKGDYETPLAEREFDNEFCLRCHDQTYDQLAAETTYLASTVGTNPHKSHNGELDCSTCHKVHRASEFYCEQCHSGTFTAPEGWE